MRIGNVEIRNNIFLAPMAGITDLPFRLICRRKGAGLAYSEMVSAKGIYYNNENTNSLLRVHPEEIPGAVQLFGSNPAIMGEIVKKIQNIPFQIIDVNMGCPAPKIVKNGEGSALMKNSKLAGEIIRSMSQATTKPVTVKIRKGFDSTSINAVEMAKRAEENGAAAIAVHGRTREEYYSGEADWEIIARVKEAVSIPVIGNGDVDTPEKAGQMLRQTQCDGIMIGRGAQGNPWLFQRTLHFLSTGELCPEPSPGEKIETALLHTRSQIEYRGEYLGIREMRKHLCWYMKGMRGAGEARTAINQAERYEEVEKILLELLQRL